MRSLAVILVVSLAAVAAQAKPSAVGRADLLNQKLSGWQGSVLVLDTPEESQNLTAVIAPIGSEMVKNENLLQKEVTPGFDELANVYNVSVTQTANGSAKISNWRDMGTSLWSTDYTVSLRGGKYVISGLDYTYSYREQSGKCSINFITGQAVVNRKKVKTAPQVIEFATAKDEVVIATCHKLLGL